MAITVVSTPDEFGYVLNYPAYILQTDSTASGVEIHVRIFIEDSPESGNFSVVAQKRLFPDSNNQVEVNLSLLSAFLETSPPDLTNTGFQLVPKASRKYKISYAEVLPSNDQIISENFHQSEAPLFQDDLETSLISGTQYKLIINSDDLSDLSGIRFFEGSNFYPASNAAWDALNPLIINNSIHVLFTPDNNSESILISPNIKATIYSNPAIYADSTEKFMVNGGFKELPSCLVINNPNNLNASANSDEQITLNWTNNTVDVDSIQIQRSLDGINFSNIDSIGSTNVSYIDTNGLLPGTLYFYRVRATKSGVNSDYSNIASAMTSFALQLVTDKIPTVSNPFDPEIIYTGSDTPVWVLPDQSTLNGTSISVTDSSSGLNGSNQTVKLLIDDKTKITTIRWSRLDLQGSYDFNLLGLTGLTEIELNNNDITGFDFAKILGITEINVGNNNITNAQSFNGCTFSNASLVFEGNNNIPSIDFTGTAGNISNFDFRSTNLSGVLNLDLMNFTSSSSIDFSNNQITGFTLNQPFRTINGNQNTAITQIDLSGCALSSTNCSISFSSCTSANTWSPPSMNPGSTIDNWNLNNTAITTALNDTWVSAYSDTMTTSFLDVATTSVTLNNNTGGIAVLALDLPNATTVNLTGLSYGESSGGNIGDIQFILRAPNLTSFSETTGQNFNIVIYTVDNFPLSNTFDLSNADISDRNLNNPAIRQLVFEDNLTATLILPTNVSHGLFLYDQRNTPTNGISFSGLGNNALDVNNASFEFTNSCSTSAEVNRVLVEIDSITDASYTGRIIQIGGTNPAPDTTSGGNDGDAASFNLLLKGITVISN